MRVLHIINGEFFAGAERVQDLLALRLPTIGYEVGFVCLKDGIFQKQRRSACALTVMAMRSKYDLSIVGRLTEHARRCEYKIIHTHTIRNALMGFLIARNLKLPWVHHVHSPAERDTEHRLRNAMNSMVEDRFLLPRADHLIAVSASLQQYLRDRGLPEENITTVSNGVPIVRDTPAWQRPTRNWIIGTVALFRPRKGVEVLLRALKQMVDKGLPVELRAIGPFETPEYEASVKQLVKDLNLTQRVHWTGFCSDVNKELAQIHLFVLPSLFGEGLPMVLLEAMALGIPVIASRVEGIPEVIGAENAGVVVNPGDHHDLANVLSDFVLHSRDAFTTASAGQRRHREHYSDVTMASSVAHIYRRLTSDFAISTLDPTKT